MGHWQSIEVLSSLLDPAERLAVLGDIAERGPSVRALADLAGLVLRRQLGEWLGWRPWAMAAAMLLPLWFAAASAHGVALILYSGHLRAFEMNGQPVLILPWVILGVPFLAWLAGYALGSLAKRRAASVLLPIVAFALWSANSASRSAALMVQAPRWPIPDDGWRGPWSHEAAVAAILMILLVPCIRGFLRGLQPRPLSFPAALFLVVLTAPAILPLTRTQGVSYASLARLLAALWPIAYALLWRSSLAKKEIA